MSKQSFKDILSIIIPVVIITVIVSLIYKLMNQTRYDGQFITKKGRAILNDEKQRAILNNAIDQYKKDGSWEGLKNLQINS